MTLEKKGVAGGLVGGNAASLGQVAQGILEEGVDIGLLTGWGLVEVRVPVL